MPSLIFNPMFENWARGLIDFDTDVFRRTLHGAGYSENKDTHDYFNDVTNEVSGAGYVAGGAVTTVTVSLDAAADQLNIVFGATTWPSSTITARKSVVRKARGGAAAADELIFVNDFGSDVVTSAGTFTHNADTVRITNPT
jgi:hypothetical protein